MARSIQQNPPELKPGEVFNVSLIHKILKEMKKKNNRDKINQELN